MAVTKTKDFKCTLDASSRIQKDGSPKQGTGADQHLMVGPTGSGTTEYRHRSFLRFDIGPDQNWDGVQQVLKAEIVLTTDNNNPNHWSGGSKPKVRARQLKSSFREFSGSEGNWYSGNWQWPDLYAYYDSTTEHANQDNLKVTLDVTKYIGRYLPSKVKGPTGAAGQNLTNYGWALYAADEYDNAMRMVYASRNHGTTSRRPILRITYVPVPTVPEAPLNLSPTGDIDGSQSFEGTHADDDGDPITGKNIQIRLKTSGAVVWNLPAANQSADPSEVATGLFSVPLSLATESGSLKSLTDYEWRAQTRDKDGWGAWSGWLGIRLTALPPTITAQALGSVDTLAGLRFGGQYSDPAGLDLRAYRIQLQQQAAPGDPSWDVATNLLWDSGETTPTSTETLTGEVSREYGGLSLSAGLYSFRVQVQNARGVWSAWSYATVTLTKDYTAAPGDFDYATIPDRDAPVRVALYAVSLDKWQVVVTATGGTWRMTGNGVTTSAIPYNATVTEVRNAVLAMYPGSTVNVDRTVDGNKRTWDIRIDRLEPIRSSITASFAALTGTDNKGTIACKAERGPGKLIGYVDDPIHLGASTYLNGPGEMFFTLPATHPYCPSIEPRVTHYAVEQWWGDRFRVLFAGLVIDFDATPDEIVFYGADYLGLFQFSVDERWDPAKIEKAADGNGGGGSKYTLKPLSFIIDDQLDYHLKQDNGSVNFIKKGTIAAMPELATIYSTYTEALPFMTGILDSHKQGTGVECRMFVREIAPNDYQIRVEDRWGKDRPNIRLQYGGLLNSFRIVALGNFATRVPAVGQKRGEAKVYRATGRSVPALDEAEWGRLASPRFFQDITDQADLQRRANEAAAQAGKIGKRIGLAIRADGLSIFDGWDVGDNIVIDVDRGVVDTARYGSSEGLPPAPAGERQTGGFWTVLGAEFHYYPDGHYETTLTVMPKKTAAAADPDLIPPNSDGVSLEWQVGYGEPVSYGEPPIPSTSPSPPTPLAVAYGDWEAPWRFGQGTTPPPATGRFRADSNTVGVPPTHLFINKHDGDGNDRSIELRTVHLGTRVYIRPRNGDGYALFRVTGDVIEQADYFDLPVERLSAPLQSLPVQNLECLLTFDVSRTTDRSLFYEPPSTFDVVSRRWLDLNTGCVWQYAGVQIDAYTKVYCPPTSDGGGGTPPDTTPPPAPEIIAIASDSAEQEDGTTVTRILVTVGYTTDPGINDLSRFIVRATRGQDSSVEPPVPDWIVAIQRSGVTDDETGLTSVGIVISPVLPATTYWLQVQAEDRSGNKSGWSALTTEVITSRDNDGPPQPTNVVTIPGMSMIGVRWDPIPAVDWSYTEVEWRPVGVGTWDAIRVKATVIVAHGFTNGVTYEVRLRSVDTSGNTLHNTGVLDPDGNPVYETVIADNEPEKGWVSGGTVMPSALPGDSLIWEDIMVENLFAGRIRADWIKAGELTVGGQGISGIVVVDTQQRTVGQWTPDGLRIEDPDNPGYELVMTEAGLAIWNTENPGQPYKLVDIGPLGIDAASITFGSQRGGHNLIVNSSFELGAFGQTQTSIKTWTVAADWNGTRVGADENITTGADSLTMTVI